MRDTGSIVCLSDLGIFPERYGFLLTKQKEYCMESEFLETQTRERLRKAGPRCTCTQASACASVCTCKHGARAFF